MNKELSNLRKKNLELARKAVKDSVNPDLFIINSISNIEELQRIINLMTKRLREWYSLYFPELDKKIHDNQAFVKLILKKDKKSLLKELKIKKSMGYELKKQDLEPVLSVAKVVNGLIKEKESLGKYLEKTMKFYCPNTLTLAGALIGAKLLKGAGSLKKLAMMRSSTIQLLGAEKALFRHIRTGAKPPKHGYILKHSLVQKAKKSDKGKAARALADKIFIVARTDYFKGKYIADKLLKELEVRFK
nr:NOP58 family protein [Nanoarchaeota archaeon]